MAENRAEPVRTMAASFVRKPFLFSEVLSTVLGRFISGIDSQYAENMRYSHPRCVRPNWFSGKHFFVENCVLTIDSEKFQSIVADFRLRWQVFDSWRLSAQHYWKWVAKTLVYVKILHWKKRFKTVQNLSCRINCTLNLTLKFGAKKVWLVRKRIR